MSEPTLARLAGGRLLMVMRGSNANQLEWPGYKWFSVSDDMGRSWSKIQPWTFDDGQPFFSPSSICHCCEHSSGRTFWVGNVSSENPCGNEPRYPLVICEIDRETGSLIHDSLSTVADRSPDQDELIEFSNFWVHEDRETQEFVLYIPHFRPNRQRSKNPESPEAYTGDLYRYRVEV